MAPVSRLLPISLLLLGGCVLDRTGQSSTEAFRRELLLHSTRIENVENLLDRADARIQQLEEVTRARGQEEILKMENLDQIRNEVARVRGELEVLQHDASLRGRDEESQAKDAQFRLLWLEARADAVEKSLGLKTVAPPVVPDAVEAGGEAVEGGEEGGEEGGDEGGEEGAATDASGPAEASPEDLMTLAEAHLAAGREAAAEAVLTRFLKEYPDHERVSEARYRMAEARFNAKDYAGAVLRFQQVIDEHRDSAWAPWAMLRQGECFEVQGQTDNAKLFYEDVIRVWPKSKAAKEARGKLGK